MEVKKMSIIVKTKEEIVVMRECGHRLARILDNVVSCIKPGGSASELDELAERLIRAAGGAPVFKGYKVKGIRAGFPGSICVSVNNEVVHGIPSATKIFKEGDVVGIDIGMRWPGGKIQSIKYKAQKKMITDMAVTIGIGRVSEEAQRLMRVTREALDIGISAVRPRVRIGDIGHAVSGHLKKHGLGIVRDLAGHGVGRELHEEPLIPNYGTKGSGAELIEGMAIAIEPMAMLGGERLVLDGDQWTYRTADGSLGAHFEHSVAVTKEGAEVLTA
jgi:methionyl aminopeptidase